MNNRYLSIDEALRALGVSVDEFKKLEASGKITPLTTLNGSKLYRSQEIEFLKTSFSHQSSQKLQDSMTNNSKQENSLTVEAAGQALQVSTKTIRRMISRGQLTASRSDRGQLFIPKPQIQALQTGGHFSIDEAAQALQVSTKTVRRMIDRGQVQTVGKTETGKILLPRNNIEQLKTVSVYPRTNGSNLFQVPVREPALKETVPVQGVALNNEAIQQFNNLPINPTPVTLHPDSKLHLHLPGKKFALGLAAANLMTFGTLAAVLIIANMIQGHSLPDALSNLLISANNILSGSQGDSLRGSVNNNSISQSLITNNSYLPLSGGELTGSVIFDEQPSFKKGIILQEKALTISQNGTLLVDGRAVTVTASSTKIQLNSNYLSSTDGSQLTNVTAATSEFADNADHLDGIDSSSFLRNDQAGTEYGAVSFVAKPGSSDVSGGPVFINPAGTDNPVYTLFGAALNGSERFKVNTQGDVTNSGGLSVGASANIAQTLAVGTNANIAGVFAVGGTTTLNGATTIQNTLQVTSNTNLDGTLDVAGDATYLGNITQSGTGAFSTGAGNVSLNGNTTVASGQNFTVTNGTTSITGVATITGTTGITGTTNINGTGSATTNIGNSSATNNISGATAILGATTINTSGSASTTIGTGTGNTALGNSTGTTSITGSTWSINSAGLLTTTAINNSGSYTQSGTSANTFTGATSFTAAGTALSITNNASVGGDLHVTGNLTVDGVTTANGNVSFGNTNANTVTFVGVVASNIVPDANNLRNIGSSSTRFNTGYFVNVDATNITGTLSSGNTTSASWIINSDNATANAETSSLTFETGTNPINAVLQWNASGDAGRVTGADNTFLFNNPIALYSQVSGGNQTFTSGTLLSYGQNAANAITQSGAFIGINYDFSSNITVPNSSNGNQTGSKVTLKDGGASATAIGYQTAGTYDIGLDIGGTPGTADIRLSNGETIDNITDGTIKLGATTLSLNGTTGITASSLSSFTTSSSLGFVNLATVTTDQTTLNLFNTTTTTGNVLGAATSLTLGATSGTASVRNATISFPNATTLSASSAAASFATIAAGATTLSGNLDMQNNIISNIGNAGTDFLSNGGLTLANALTVSTGGANIVGVSAIGNTTTDSAQALRVVNDSLSGTSQYSLVSHSPFTSSATTAGYEGYFQLRTANSSFTMANGYGLYVDTPSKGGLSTITSAYGAMIKAQTAGGTNNYGLYVEAPSGGSTINAAAYFGGNVGIGTTAPASGLHIESTGAQAKRGIRLAYDSSYYNVIEQAGAAGLVFNNSQIMPYDFQQAGTSKVRIDASGNVGIGTTAPSKALSVSGEMNFYTGSSVRGIVGPPTWDTTYMALQNGSLTESASNAAIFQSNVGATTIGAPTGQSISLKLNNDGAGQGLFQMTANTFAFTAGNVGIGSSTPTALLDLASSTTTGTASRFLGNSLTTGTLMQLTSTSLTSGSFFDINNGSSIFNISQTGVTSSLPQNYTSAGDVNVAYDINFTNPTSSYIKSAAPLYVQAGETFGSSDLTLRTFNSGQGIFDFAGGASLIQAQNWDLQTSSTSALNVRNSAGTSIFDIDSTNGRVGIGTTNPSALLNVYSSGNSTNIANFVWTTSSTSIGGGSSNQLAIINADTTTNNWSRIDFNDTQGNNQSSSGSIAFQYTDRTNHYGDLAFATRSAAGYSEKLRITSGGNVGIGTTAPGAPLHVSSGDSIFGAGNGAAGVSLASGTISQAQSSTLNIQGFGASNSWVGFNQYYDGAWKSVSTDAFQIQQSGTSLYFLGDSGLTANTSYTPTTRMTILSSGNVGIGTTTPGVKLDVSGDIRGTRGAFGAAGASPNYALQVVTSSGGTTGLFQAGISGVTNGFTINTDASNNLTYSMLTGGQAQGFYQNASGSVGIGTTGPLDLLHVYGNTNGAVQARIDNASTGTGAYKSLQFYQGGTEQAGINVVGSGIVGESLVGGANALQIWNYQNAPTLFSTNNTERLRITAGGNVGIGTTAPARALDVFTSGATELGLNSTSSPNGNIWRFISDTDSSLQIYNQSQAKYAIYSNPRTSVGIFMNTNGSVGIGTTSPGATLHLNSGNLRLSTAGKLQLESSDNLGSYYMWNEGSAGTDKMAFGTTSGTAQIVFDNGGSVGIGTTTPGFKLNLYDTNATAARIESTANQPFATNDNATLVVARNEGSYATDSGGTLGLGSTLGSGNGNVFALLKGASEAGANAGYLAFGTRTNAAYATERMRITSGGNVGIGTTNPVGLFTVFGTGSTLILDNGGSNTTSNGLYIRNSGSATGYIQYSQNLNFQSSGGVPQITFNTAGSVGIGTTAPNSVKFEVYNGNTRLTSSGDASILQFDDTGASLNQKFWDWTARNGTLELRTVSDDYSSASDVLTITRSGTTVSSTNINNGNFYVASGSVGIGTTTASHQLTVGSAGQGSFKAANTESYYLTRTTSTGSSDWVEIGTITTNATVQPLSYVVEINQHSNEHQYSEEYYGTNFLTTTNWTELAPRNGFAWSGGRSVALEAAQGADIYTVKLRIRNLGAHSGAGTAYITVHVTNGTLAASSATGNGGTLSTGFAAGNIGWYFPVQNSTQFAPSTSGMFINSSGNVGIGTTNPTRPLDIFGAVGTLGLTATTGTNGAYARYSNTGGNAYSGLETSGGGGLFTGTSAYSAVFGSDSARSVHFATNNAARMTIDSNGSVGIGITNPGAVLQVNSGVGNNARNAAMIIKGASASSLVSFFEVSGACGNPANSAMDICKDTGTNRSINAGGSINASGADYAEYFYQETPGSLQKGDLVCLSSNGKAEKCNEDGKLIGVVSTNPGYVGNDLYDPNNPDNTILVGLVGQISTSISTENGPIAIGDFLSMSPANPGVAVKATRAGEIIGKALESYNGSGIGKISTFVKATWYDPDVYLTDTGDLHVNSVDFSVTKHDTATNSDSVVDRIGSFSKAVVGVLTGGYIQSQSLNVTGSVDAYSVKVNGSEVATREAIEELSDRVNGEASNSASLSLRLTDLEARMATMSATIDISSSSAVIADSLSANNLTISNNVTINNSITSNSINSITATFSNLGVTGNITNGMITINGLNSSIDSLTEPLKLQPNALAGIDILNGRITIDSSGNLNMVGDITTSGNVNASEAVVNKVVITTPAEATGSAVLAAQSTTIGSGTFFAGQTIITIQNNTVTANSKIFITPTSNTDKVISVVTKTAGSGFTVQIPSSSTSNITFDYWIIN